MEGNYGKPVQILKLNPKTNKYELSVDELKKIFLDEKIKDVNLSVVSIAGAFRKGKSFLLSFLMRYVNAFYHENSVTDNTNWLGNKHDKLTGFEWRGGSKRHTTGIWIWSKIFIKQLSNGQRIGIVLMDTQGTFDSESSMHTSVTIFALSTMISSIQIYNLFNNIQEDDLQHLHLFTEYGRIAKENTKDYSKPFQQLMFLVRDWNFPTEHPYGSFSGNKKLEQLLKIKPHQPPEIQSVRKHLRSSFDEITCYLMPSPGNKVRSKKQFDGRLSDLAPVFVRHLNRLIPLLLKPENVVKNGLKKVCGASVKPHEFFRLIEQYWKVFSSVNLPEAKSILTATTEAACLTAKSDITQCYLQSMTKITQSTSTNTELIEIHKNLSTQALKKYDSRVVMGDIETRNYHRHDLEKFLQEHVTIFLAMLQSKKEKTLEDTIKKLMQEIADLRKRDSASETLLVVHTKLQEFIRKSLSQQMEQIDAIKNLIKLSRLPPQPNENPPESKSWCLIM